MVTYLFEDISGTGHCPGSVFGDLPDHDRRTFQDAVAFPE